MLAAMPKIKMHQSLLKPFVFPPAADNEMQGKLFLT